MTVHDPYFIMTLTKVVATSIKHSCGLEPMGDLESEELQFQAKSKSIEELARDIAQDVLDYLCE